LRGDGHAASGTGTGRLRLIAGVTGLQPARHLARRPNAGGSAAFRLTAALRLCQKRRGRCQSSSPRECIGEAKSMARQPILEFWYEFASTYSYLAAMRVEAAAAEADVAIRWRPFLVGPLFAAQGWTTSPFN